MHPESRELPYLPETENGLSKFLSIPEIWLGQVGPHLWENGHPYQKYLVHSRVKVTHCLGSCCVDDTISLNAYHSVVCVFCASMHSVVRIFLGVLQFHVYSGNTSLCSMPFSLCHCHRFSSPLSSTVITHKYLGCDIAFLMCDIMPLLCTSFPTFSGFEVTQASFFNSSNLLYLPFFLFTFLLYPLSSTNSTI